MKKGAIALCELQVLTEDTANRDPALDSGQKNALPLLWERRETVWQI